MEVSGGDGDGSHKPKKYYKPTNNIILGEKNGKTKEGRIEPVTSATEVFLNNQLLYYIKGHKHVLDEHVVKAGSNGSNLHLFFWTYIFKSESGNFQGWARPIRGLWF